MERCSCLLPDYYPSVTLQQQQQQKQWLLPQNVKVGNDGVFMEDLLVEILARLPVRYVVRMRRVCKSWRALIDDVHFIKRHYHLQCSRGKADGDIPIIGTGAPLTDDHLILTLHVFLLSKKKEDEVPLELTADLLLDSAGAFANVTHIHPWDGKPFDEGSIVGVVNGLVCFMWDKLNSGLWNPATREFKAIPPWVNRVDISYDINLIGFGYDRVSNDFKIVRGIWKNPTELIGHELYSLTTNSWKRLKEVSPLVCSLGNRRVMNGYLDGVCYWSVSVLGDMDNRKMVLSFNFSTEVFEVFNPPHNAIASRNGYKCRWMVMMYMETLAIVVTFTNFVKVERHFEVWVATKFYGNSGTPKSWRRAFNMGPFRSYEELSVSGFTTDGNALFTECLSIPNDGLEDSSLYYPSTRTFKRLGIFLDWPFSYVESLFPLSNKQRSQKGEIYDSNP